MSSVDFFITDMIGEICSIFQGYVSKLWLRIDLDPSNVLICVEMICTWIFKNDIEVLSKLLTELLSEINFSSSS